MKFTHMATGERLASGEYHYFENGEQRNIVEPWSLYSGGGADDILAVSQRRVEDAGIVIDVAVEMTQGLCRRAHFSWSQAGSRGGAATEAVYAFDSGALSALAIDGRETGAAEGFDYFFPLMRVFTGPLLAHLAQRSSACVLVPWIKDPSNLELLFTADLSERSVEDVGRLRAEGGNVQMLEYNGGQYEQAASCVLLEGNWLQAYSWRMNPTSSWEVRLVSPVPRMACPDFTVV